MDGMSETSSTQTDEQVRIWSITMNKNSAGTFRLLFFLLTGIMIVFALLLSWVIWKVYPLIKSGGRFGKLLNLAPFTPKTEQQAAKMERSINRTNEEG